MMAYRVAAVDVHKKMLAVVVADVGGEGEYQFERRKFGATPDQLHVLAQWLVQQEVEEVVMESTAQYWKPVWGALERYWKPERQKREGAPKMSGALHLCQAKSNRGPRGRKNDFADGERMIKRLVAQELVLSFVPDAEQRLWRTVTRRKHQLTRDKVRFQNQLESLLEQAHLKLSSFVSDLLGVSARRMLKALAEGETDPGVLAALADCRLRATPEQLRDALGACTATGHNLRSRSGLFFSHYSPPRRAASRLRARSELATRGRAGQPPRSLCFPSPQGGFPCRISSVCGRVPKVSPAREPSRCAERTLGVRTPGGRSYQCRSYTHSLARCSSTWNNSPIRTSIAPHTVRSARPNVHSPRTASTPARSSPPPSTA